MPGQWYVMGRDEIHGPYSKQKLLRLIAAKRVAPSTRVREGNVGPWRLAAKVPGLLSQDTNSSAHSCRTRLSPSLTLSLIVGGAVIATSILTAGICIIVFGLRGHEAAPQETPTAVEPVVDSGLTVDTASPQLVLGEAPNPEDPEPTSEQIAVSAPPVAEPNLAQVDAILYEEAQASDEVEVPAADVVLNPKPIIPPIPAEKLRIEDAKITDFNKSVRLETKATDAYARYIVFSQSFAFTKEQRDRIDSELAEWKERADEDLFRLGTTWVSFDKVEAAQKDADRLIERAFALIKTGSYKECVNFLEDASRANPNGIRADYLLGWIYSFPWGLKAADLAEKHFRRVLQRSPSNAAALNSVAISQIKQREFGVAYTNFARSAELTPKCQEVAHNLGRAIMLAKQGRLQIEPGQLRRYTDLYSELIADERGTPYDERTGWIHMWPVFPLAERRQDPPAERDPQFVIAKWGSGFVVNTEFVVTNRHVVEGKDGQGLVDVVGIIDPDDPAHSRELKGTVTAVSDTTDLAIVRFPGLKAPRLQIASVQSRQAEEVMILGFPRSDLFGTSMKSTRGVISDLPNPKRSVFPAFYLFDAISDHGNSGGPIIDRSGKVIAVLTGGVGLQARVAFDLEAEFTAGVPSSEVAAFANQFINGFVADQHAGQPVARSEWAEVVAQITPSVLHLTCYYKAGLAGIELAGDGQKGTSGAWQDYTCPLCSGQGRVACPGKRCISGRVSTPYYVDEVVGAGMNRQVIRHKRIRKEACSTCGGAGTLDCRGCVEGVDSLLKD